MAKFDRFGWIKGAIKRLSYRYPPHYTAKTLARVSRGLYLCAKCEGTFKVKEIQVDHINPVINPLTGWVDWNDFVERLLPPSHTDFQVLCKGCHSAKSTVENAIRREVKKESKE